jgi:ribonuclease HII
MLVLHEAYPMYGFDRHKGYPTEFHLQALRTYGPISAHRRSYAPVAQLTLLM